jgi:phosphoribosylglycinamide formyltransferase-1
VTARLVVLASGNGSNFQALLDAALSGALDAAVVGLVTSTDDAYAIERAHAASVPVVSLVRRPGEERGHYDERLAETVVGFEPDFVVLAGWMRLLTMRFLSRFPNRVVNLHPALPGEFPGTDAIARALDAARESGLSRTGVMVHFVPDEGVDDGPVIATAAVPILADDTLDTLSARVHAAEHRLLVDALRHLVNDRHHTN